MYFFMSRLVITTITDLDKKSLFWSATWKTKINGFFWNFFFTPGPLWEPSTLKISADPQLLSPRQDKKITNFYCLYLYVSCLFTFLGVDNYLDAPDDQVIEANTNKAKYMEMKKQESSENGNGNQIELDDDEDMLPRVEELNWRKK